ncbi:MAG: indolepyruvate oxidoreductase subunit beta [Deltaproteobacteria bacterium]|nr:indolepyruvate oxidoreductase subunit beta [Deltaproteobacteria bacterium]
MNDYTLSIYVSGVGGFGIGSVIRILSSAAQIRGLKAIGSETHGLAQRGGVVISTLQIGKDVTGSPLIIKGAADIVITLEPLEALRAMPYLKRKGVIIYNTQKFQPLSVRLGSAQYPTLDNIKAELERVTDRVIPVNASAKAKELGLSESANVILLGRLTSEEAIPFDIETMRQAIRETTPARYLDINLRALEVG